MKIKLTTNDGVLIDTIEDVEKYDLDKKTGRTELIDEIKDAIEREQKFCDIYN